MLGVIGKAFLTYCNGKCTELESRPVTQQVEILFGARNGDCAKKLGEEETEETGTGPVIDRRGDICMLRACLEQHE